MDTLITVDQTRRRIEFAYTFHSAHWEPSLTALLLCEGMVKASRYRYYVSFLEPVGTTALDLLAIGRRAQKQLAHLSKHSVLLSLKSSATQLPSIETRKAS